MGGGLRKPARVQIYVLYEVVRRVVLPKRLRKRCWRSLGFNQLEKGWKAQLTNRQTNEISGEVRRLRHRNTQRLG